jgi:ADP-heptose:LPS heptosyltransferase
VVIDSFLSHLAGALNTPAVVLFGPAPARVTGPKGNPEKLIFLEPNKLDVCPIMTNCWGKAGETQCDSPCINTINPLVVAKALKELLKPFGV